MDTSTHSKIPRKSYTREFKLRVVEHYREAREGNTKTRISDTARHFNLDDSNVRRWLKSEIKLKHSPKGAKSHGSGRKSFFPELEKQIHEEFTEIRVWKPSLAGLNLVQPKSQKAATLNVAKDGLTISRNGFICHIVHLLLELLKHL